MAATMLTPETLDEIRLVTPPRTDRLPAMLFLAALIHGILIIGITFNSVISDQFADAISLEVTIVADPDQSIDRPDDAEYLAQASQQGGGNTSAQVRPSAPLQSASPVDNLGEQDGESLVDATSHEVSSDQVLTTRQDTEQKVPDDPREQPQPDDATAIALERGSETTLPLPQDDRASMLITDDDPRQLIISADTAESNAAAYLDSWKRRVEAVGAAYFPELGDLRGVGGNPTLEVSIDSKGNLLEVIIRKSSGSPVIDQAALDILTRASPFDPFPRDIAMEYDKLRFAYKWLFNDQLEAATASVN